MINQELEKLYSKWRNPNVHFVDGGVVGQHMYESSGVKLLMVLKEVNDAEQKAN